MSRTDPLWVHRYGKLCLAVVVLFAFGMRIVRLNSPNERYFDEVYHAYTAEQWAKGNTDAWRWDTHAPDKGCSYEWTHPPLAKLIMSWCMCIFGVHPWAWRLPATFFGIASVLLVYLIGKDLFGLKSVGLLAASLASLDTLPLFASRIGMNDVYCVTFILLSVWLIWHRRSFLAVLAIGLGIACKWTALFALPLLLLIRVSRRRKNDRSQVQLAIDFGLLWTALTPVIYVATYIPFFTAGNSLSDFNELQNQMWTYHTRLDKTHPFSSKAWEWPLTGGQVWCYTDERGESTNTQEDTNVGKSTKPTHAANIYAMGNPVIWLGGLASVAFLAITTAYQRRLTHIILLVAYLVFWAPWLFSPRIMFLYHYLPSVSFLYIAMAWAVLYVRLSPATVFLLLLASAISMAAQYSYVTAVYMPWTLTPGHWWWLS